MTDTSQSDELVQNYREKLRAAARERSREKMRQSPVIPGTHRVVYDEENALYVDYYDEPRGKFPVRAFVLSFAVLATWKLWVEADLRNLPVRRNFVVGTVNEFVGYEILNPQSLQRPFSLVRRTPCVRKDADGIPCIQFSSGLPEVRDSCWAFTKNWIFGQETLRSIGFDSLGIENQEAMETEILSLGPREFGETWFWRLNDAAGNRVHPNLRISRRS